MSELEPDFISSYHENRTEFMEDLRPRRRQHSVFEDALETVDFFSTERVTEENIHEYWSEHNPIIHHLNKIATEAGLLNKIVILEGKDINIPNVTVDLTSDTTRVKMADTDSRVDQSLQKTLAPDAYKGEFKGFSIRFKKVPDEDEYYPALSYKVYAGGYHTPNSDVEVFATGSVGLTMISFEADIKLDELKVILESLYLLAPDASESISRMNTALNEEQLSCSSMKYINFHAEKIIDSIDKDNAKLIGAVEDGIADLIRHYINPHVNYSISTKIYIKSQSTLKQNAKSLITSSANPFVFHEQIKDVSYINELKYTKKGIVPKSERSLHIIVKDRNDIDYDYIPLKDLQDFKKK